MQVPVSHGTVARVPSEIATVFADPDTCAASRDPLQEEITLQLDDDVVVGLQATGTDWQVRFNAILRAWLETHPRAQ